MDFILAIVIGIAWGWWAREKHAEKQVNKLFSRLDAAADEEQGDNHIIARVEKHGDMFYLFDEKNDHFLAQGRTWEEILEILSDRFRGGKKVLVRKDQAEELGLL